MDEPKQSAAAESKPSQAKSDAPVVRVTEPLARGSGHIGQIPPVPPLPRTRTEDNAPVMSDTKTPAIPRARTEDSVMEGLPEAKAERIAAMRRDLAELQRQLIEAQQRIATELQGRAEDAERIEMLEALVGQHEQRTFVDTARVAELESEVSGLRTQIEEARRQHREVTEHLEKKTSALNEARALLESRDVELGTTTAERDSEQSARSRLERELDEQRELNRGVTEELEEKRTSERNTKARMETREVELAAMIVERDELKAEIERERRELESLRAKAREVASQLVRFGQDLGGGAPTASTSEVKPSTESPTASTATAEAPAGTTATAAPQSVGTTTATPTTNAVAEPTPVVARANTVRPPPPPLPRARTEPTPVSAILEVVEEPKPKSRVGAALLLIGGTALGFVATFAFVKNNGSSTTNAAATSTERGEDVGAPAAATAPLTTESTEQPAPTAAVTEAQPNAFGQAAPTSEPSITAPAVANAIPSATSAEANVGPSAAAGPVSSVGILVLPSSASGHRVFVDGRVIDVKGSRAVIPCGAHTVRIGSRGNEKKLDVACGSETTVADD